MKKLLALLLVAATSLSMVACGNSASSSAAAPASSAITSSDSASVSAPDKVYTMNIGSAVSSANPSSIALQSFKVAVEQRTNGGIKVEVYTDSALGGEADLLEQVTGGSIEGCMQMGAANWESMNPEVDVALLPFLFTSLENAREAWGGEFGKQFATELIEPTGCKVLSIWESGYRHMTNNTRPIVTPADVKGIKFRTNENSMKVAMYDALDASVVIMPFSDVYTALQNGTIGGQENPLSNIYTASLQDVQKYLSLTGHMYDAAPLVCNAAWFNSLPAEYQTVLMEEAATAREVELKENDESKYLNLLKQAGMEVNEVDAAAFQACMNDVWQKYISSYERGQYWVDLATSFNK
ncbi:MAG TPA: DctP family TRAP transporter solute-binding subunit [Clostridia bacterium]|nr:DctP family TRAP transporter solute-binding subunit [Clostridia bacterium]